MLSWLFSKRPEPAPEVAPEVAPEPENAIDVALRAFQHELASVPLRDYQPLFDLLRARFEALENEYRGLDFYENYLRAELERCTQRRAQLDEQAELISAQYDFLSQKGVDKWQILNS